MFDVMEFFTNERLSWASEFKCSLMNDVFDLMHRAKTLLTYQVRWITDGRMFG